MSTIHEDYIYRIVSQRDAQGRVKSRERNNLEYKESFGLSSWAKYAKTMAAFANNQGGYILFLLNILFLRFGVGWVVNRADTGGERQPTENRNAHIFHDGDMCA